MVIRAKAKVGEPMEMEEYQQVAYGMTLWMLQENVGLSYKEARAYLAPERYESTEDLIKALKVTEQEVHNLVASAEEKMNKIENWDSVLNGYFPLIVDTAPWGGPLF